MTTNISGCQFNCQQNQECQVWTFNAISGGKGNNCWLKTSDAFMSYSCNRVSGPKYCGKKILFPNIFFSNTKLINTIHLIEPCETTIIEESYGTSIGDQCIFPFTYKGIKYDSCVKTDDAECEWCPTKLDASGVYIAPGDWGCCNDACPKTIDKGIDYKICCMLKINIRKH